MKSKNKNESRLRELSFTQNTCAKNLILNTVECWALSNRKRADPHEEGDRADGINGSKAPTNLEKRLSGQPASIKRRKTMRSSVD